jgi:dTDP-4-dehydrorhamnose reductase
VKVLITGASGQVATALLASVPASMNASALTRQQLDICDAGAVRALVAQLRPALIINAAAYTAVDKAEAEPALATAVNAEAVRHLAQAAQAISGCRLLHISTDYVFDGRASEPYRPGDPTNPLSVYGRSKLQGERAALEVLAERAIVLRTAWVYADQGRNFLLTMLRLMRDRGAVRVVADQYGTPTAAGSIARALWAIAQRPEVHGILHWTDAGMASWYEFALAIAEEARAARLLAHPIQVTPITSAQYPTAAPRPAYSVLDTRLTSELLALSAPAWRVNLRTTLAQLAQLAASA